MDDRPGDVRHGRRVPRRIEALTRLARVTSELAMADTVDGVSKIVTYHIADAVGATIAALALREDEQVRLIALRGLGVEEAGRWEVFPLAQRTPASDAIRTGERIVVVGAADLVARYPGLADVDRGERTVVAVPLRVTGRTIGSIALSFPGAVEPDPAELDFLEIMADTCAQAFQRIEASAVAATQTQRLAFLAEASIELASSLDLDVTTKRGGPAGRPDVRRLVRHRRRPGRQDAPSRRRARRPGEGRARPAPAGAVAPRPHDRRRGVARRAHRPARADPRDHRRDARRRAPGTRST